MGLGMTSVYLLLAAAGLMSSRAVLLNVTTDEVVVGKTTNVSLECTDNYHQHDVVEVVMIRMLKKSVTGWTSVAELRDDDTEVTQTLQGVKAEANKSSLYNSFLRLTWPVATKDTIGEYRCDVISLTSQESFNWQKSLPATIYKKNDVTLNTLSEIVEGNRMESIRRLRAQRQSIMEDVARAVEGQREGILSNLSAALEDMGDSFESQLQALSDTFDRNKRQFPHQLLSHKRQVMARVETALEQNNREFLRRTEGLLQNVTEIVERGNSELQRQRDSILEDARKTVAEANRECLQQRDDILQNVTAMVQALEASVESRLNATEVQEKLLRTCADVQSTNPRPVVTLDNDMTVVCDTETDHGGWIVFQRRTSGDVDFYRGWAEYKDGFGDLYGNFWLGLEKIHQLTNKGNYELRIDFSFDGTDYHAQYNSFSIMGESDNYKLRVSGFTGNLEDNMDYHNGREFSTKDRDNDEYSGSCAKSYHGAWWYNTCHRVNLNGDWGSTKSSEGLNWKSVTTYTKSATFSEMKMRPLFQ